MGDTEGTVSVFGQLADLYDRLLTQPPKAHIAFILLCSVRRDMRGCLK
jgi:hypothetical protein